MKIKIIFILFISMCVNGCSGNVLQKKIYEDDLLMRDLCSLEYGGGGKYRFCNLQNFEKIYLSVNASDYFNKKSVNNLYAIISDELNRVNAIVDEYNYIIVDESNNNLKTGFPENGMYLQVFLSNLNKEENKIEVLVFTSLGKKTSYKKIKFNIDVNGEDFHFDKSANIINKAVTWDIFTE